MMMVHKFKEFTAVLSRSKYSVNQISHKTEKDEQQRKMFNKKPKKKESERELVPYQLIYNDFQSLFVVGKFINLASPYFTPFLSIFMAIIFKLCVIPQNQVPNAAIKLIEDEIFCSHISNGRID